MSNKNTSKNIWLHIMGVLILAELLVGIMTISEELFVDIINLLPLLFVALYGFVFYKKPHDNMLKYTMLILAVGQMLNAIAGLRNGWDNLYNQSVRVFAAAILIYVAGRLNRIEQNKYLLLISFVIQLIRGFVVVYIVSNVYNSVYSPAYIFTWFSGAVSTLTLMIAYFTRYKEHREAGLQDAPKAK